MKPPTLYELRGVSRSFTQGSVAIHAVDRVDLEIAQGEVLAIEGPSGSGKTTLLQLLGALDRPTEGSVLFEGDDLAAMRDHELARLRLRAFGFVFQQFNLIPTLTSVQNIEAALAPTGAKAPELRDRAGELLAEVGLGHRAAHLPSQLSGGEQQRVAIGRALAVEPRVILADEPTGNLDTQTGGEIIELLTGLGARHGATVIVATHDAALASRAPQRVEMRDGRISGWTDAASAAAPRE